MDEPAIKKIKTDTTEYDQSRAKFESEIDDICDELYEVKAKIKQMITLEKELTRKLKSRSNNTDVSTKNFVYYKSVRKGLVDYSKIEALKTIDLDKYRRKDVETWTLKKLNKDT